MQMGCSKLSAEAAPRTACKLRPHLVSEPGNIQIFCKCFKNTSRSVGGQGTSMGFKEKSGSYVPMETLSIL